MRSFFQDARRRRRLLLYLLIQGLALALLAIAYLYRAYLDTLPGNGRLSLCPMHDFLHLYCPGCGGTRAMLALLRGNLLYSLCANPISAYLAVGFVAMDVRAAIAIFRNEERVLRLPAWYFWGMLAIAVTFCLARNVLMISVGYDYLGDLVGYWHS